MLIAVDFDGTIVEHKYPKIGKEIPFAISTLKKMAESGHKLVLWTVREGKLLEEAVQFCKVRGLEFYAVNSEFPELSWNHSSGSRKVSADIYIDDRNLGGLPDWNLIYEMVMDHLSYTDMLERMEANSEFYNGSFKKKSSSQYKKKKRRSLFGRMIDRMHEARYRYR